jgi:hypothetical protein
MGKSFCKIDNEAFWWSRNSKGYKWFGQDWDGGPNAPPEKKVLAAVLGARDSGRDEGRYQPLVEQPGLFRAFSEVPPTPEGVIEFANAFGSLWPNSSFVENDPDDPGKQLVLTGTSLEFVRAEIQSMHEAVSMWAMVQAQDVKGLSRCIRRYSAADPEPGAVVFHPEHLPGSTALGPPRVICSPTTAPDWYYKCVSGDVDFPARLLIGQLIRSRLLWQEAVRLQMKWDDHSMASVFRIEPTDLRYALWLQFAEAVCGEKEFRCCPICHTWFELGEGKTRKSKQFCSVGCRTKAYRDRREEARDLFKDGSSVAEIAEKLKSDVDTVTKWVNDNEERS